ncbi:hypothetical protein KAI12_02150 [Candidatus Bathyarchaeota archaeon]|nr:hypothetical protein [Candidatus Bathyarchaeota archaeon]
MKEKINWFGLAAGIVIIALVAVSFFIPWWQISAGENLVEARVSPVNTYFNFLGDTVTVPLISALNLASVLSLVAGGLAILIYSLTPTKSYSKHLLGFSYRKPLIALLLFVGVLFALTFVIQSVFSFHVPLYGSEISTLPTTLTNGTTIEVSLSAEFKWPFWLAVMAAGLCIATRIYHKKANFAQEFVSNTVSSTKTTK